MRSLTFILMAVTMTGCTLAPGKPAPEPPTIVIRNSCARDLSRVVLKEPREEGKLVSMGSISPVLRSAPFVYRRASNPPPMLRTMKVVWTEAGGATHEAILSLDAVLKKATGAADEALVFHLQPGGRVSVYLDRIVLDGW